MAATIWFPGYTLEVNAGFLRQEFVATAGQTNFVLTNFTYAPGTNAIAVFINGQLQKYITDYIEVNDTTITFLSPLVLNDKVAIIRVGAVV